MSEEGYDLKKSKEALYELYPVLKDAYGNVIDGFHRLDADPKWRTETLERIDTPTALHLARIVANTHRRTISKEERRKQIAALADSLMENDGIRRGDVVSTIAELTSFAETYIRRLLPKESKRTYTNSALSAELEEGMSDEEFDRMDKQHKKNVKADKEWQTLVDYYGSGALDDVLRRMKVTSFDTRKKYMQRYVMRLNARAPEELKREIIERLEY